MNNPSNDSDLAKHQRFVELLAQETRQPIDHVASLYRGVLSQLIGKAVIPDFVPVFAWRRTRALLHHR